MAEYVEQIGDVTVTVTVYSRGLRDLVLDPMFAATLTAHAKESKARAVADAKEHDQRGRQWGRRGSQRRTGSYYSESFDTDIGYGTTIDGTARIRARLVNTNPFAMYIEYGNANIQPARRIVRKAAGINRFDAQGDKY